MLTSDQKGSIAELAIALSAIKLGVGVYKPLSDGHRYDLVFDHEGRLWRVQCKWARRRGGVVVVNCRSCRRSANGHIHKTYTADEVDLFGAYCLEADRCFLLPVTAVPAAGSIYLRLAPTSNAQRAGVNWADDFDFEATLARPGAVA